MTSRKRNLVFNTSAVLIGAISIYFVYLFGNFAYCCLLVCFLLLAVAFALRYKFVPWLLIVITLISNYIVGLIFIPGWGNLLPFEIVLILLYWVVIGAISKFGLFVSKKYNERKA